MSHNQNNDIMKPTDYIEWDNLKNIPFFLCQVVEDKENKDIDIYYLGKRVFHDYDHVGHYMRSAIILFRRIKNRTADWVNLQNLWTLRNCIRENYNHGIGVDSLIYGEASAAFSSTVQRNVIFSVRFTSMPAKIGKKILLSKARKARNVRHGHFLLCKHAA